MAGNKELASARVIDAFLKEKGWSMSTMAKEIVGELAKKKLLANVPWSKDTINNLKRKKGMFKEDPHIEEMIAAGIIEDGGKWHQAFLKAIELDNQEELPDPEPEPFVVKKIEEIPPAPATENTVEESVVLPFKEPRPSVALIPLERETPKKDPPKKTTRNKKPTVPAPKDQPSTIHLAVLYILVILSVVTIISIFLTGLFGVFLSITHSLVVIVVGVVVWFAGKNQTRDKAFTYSAFVAVVILVVTFFLGLVPVLIPDTAIRSAITVVLFVVLIALLVVEILVMVYYSSRKQEM
jgi:hypothetical protein